MTTFLESIKIISLRTRPYVTNYINFTTVDVAKELTFVLLESSTVVQSRELPADTAYGTGCCDAIPGLRASSDNIDNFVASFMAFEFNTDI